MSYTGHEARETLLFFKLCSFTPKTLSNAKFIPCTQTWGPFVHVTIVTGGIPDLGGFPLWVWLRILHRLQDCGSVFLYLLLTGKGREEGGGENKENTHRTFSGGQIISTFTRPSQTRSSFLTHCSALSTLLQSIRPRWWWAQRWGKPWMDGFKEHLQPTVPTTLETQEGWIAAISWKCQKKKVREKNVCWNEAGKRLHWDAQQRGWTCPRHQPLSTSRWKATGRLKHSPRILLTLETKQAAVCFAKHVKSAGVNLGSNGYMAALGTLNALMEKQPEQEGKVGVNRTPLKADSTSTAQIHHNLSTPPSELLANPLTQVSNMQLLPMPPCLRGIPRTLPTFDFLLSWFWAASRLCVLEIKQNKNKQTVNEQWENGEGGGAENVSLQGRNQQGEPQRHCRHWEASSFSSSPNFWPLSFSLSG